MNMLDSTFHEDLKTFRWFVSCGKTLTSGTQLQRAASLQEALSLLASPQWADTRTQAQGDLTGYLAANHYASYGGSWNNLARESRARLERELLPTLRCSLAEAGLPDITRDVMLDLNRAALEASYALRFPRITKFFSRLLAAYSGGHLPCGWTLDIEQWPAGQLIVY